MGALTQPVFLCGRRVASGDVVVFEPVGVGRLWRRRVVGVVDARDRSVPYLVLVRRGRVLRVPLEGNRIGRGRRLRVYRLPGIGRHRAARVAARAAWRPGEGVHHPDYDCGRRLPDGVALVRDAYAAIDVAVESAGSVFAPLREVLADDDPPHALFGGDEAGPRDLARRFLSGGRPPRSE